MSEKPNVVPLNVMGNIVKNIGSSSKMREIFGDDVLEKIGIFPIDNDFKISEAGLVQLTEEKKEIFKNELEAIIVKSFEAK